MQLSVAVSDASHKGILHVSGAGMVTSMPSIGKRQRWPVDNFSEMRIIPGMNRGAQELGRRLRRMPRGAQQRMAEELSTSSGVISHWLSGERKPNAHFRGLLNELYGIPWPAWDKEVS